MFRWYSVLYSYATSDPYYRGQRGQRVWAKSPKDAIEKIRKGEGSVINYPPCPSAQIVRCTVSRKQAGRPSTKAFN